MQFKKVCPDCAGSRREVCSCDRVTRQIHCTSCKGSGISGKQKVWKKVPRTTMQEQWIKKECGSCNGRGKVYCPDCNGIRDRTIACLTCDNNGYFRCGTCRDGVITVKENVAVQHTETCPDCLGQKAYSCADCNGNGYVESDGKRIGCKSCNTLGGHNCSRCHGHGSVPFLVEHEVEEPIVCKQCSGQGSHACNQCNANHERKCTRCGGSGQVFTYMGIAAIAVLIILGIILINVLDINIPNGP